MKLSNVDVLPQLQMIRHAARELASKAERFLAVSRKRDLRRARACEPAWAARLPRETAGQLADAIEIAFQIREAKFARRFVNILLARKACGADCDHRSFHRLAILQLVRLADFKQSQIALAMI